jgi:hypothetical protein
MREVATPSRLSFVAATCGSCYVQNLSPIVVNECAGDEGE